MVRIVVGPMAVARMSSDVLMRGCGVILEMVVEDVCEQPNRLACDKRRDHPQREDPCPIGQPGENHGHSVAPPLRPGPNSQSGASDEAGEGRVAAQSRTYQGRGGEQGPT
jgi:hypothetical protein